MIETLDVIYILVEDLRREILSHTIYQLHRTSILWLLVHSCSGFNFLGLIPSLFTVQCCVLVGYKRSVITLTFRCVLHVSSIIFQGERDGSNEYSNYQPGALNTTDQIIKDLKNIDIVFHIGDLSYANGYISQWDQFTAQVEPIASTVPYMVGRLVELFITCFHQFQMRFIKLIYDLG